jgi:hypothetical protein
VAPGSGAGEWRRGAAPGSGAGEWRRGVAPGSGAGEWRRGVAPGSGLPQPAPSVRRGLPKDRGVAETVLLVHGPDRMGANVPKVCSQMSRFDARAAIGGPEVSAHAHRPPRPPPRRHAPPPRRHAPRHAATPPRHAATPPATPPRPPPRPPRPPPRRHAPPPRRHAPRHAATPPATPPRLYRVQISGSECTRPMMAACRLENVLQTLGVAARGRSSDSLERSCCVPGWIGA